MLLSALMLPATAHLLDIDDFGARRNDSSEPAIRANIKAFNLALADAKPSDTVLISAGKSAYTFRGSILATNLFNVSLQIDGNIVLDDTIKAWPAPSSGMRPPPWFYLFNSSHIIVSGAGEIDGQGLRWWDASITGSVAGLGERRPNIFLFDHVSDLLLERLTLRNSPHFHVKFNQCARVIVRYLTIDVDRFAQRRLKARAHAQRLTSAGLLNHSAATALTQRLYSSSLESHCSASADRSLARRSPMLTRPLLNCRPRCTTHRQSSTCSTTSIAPASPTSKYGLAACMRTYAHCTKTVLRAATATSRMATADLTLVEVAAGVQLRFPHSPSTFFRLCVSVCLSTVDCRLVLLLAVALYLCTLTLSPALC